MMFRSVLAASVVGIACHADFAHAVVLFDGAGGSTPVDDGMFYFTVPLPQDIGGTSATLTPNAMTGRMIFDTTPDSGADPNVGDFTDLAGFFSRIPQLYNLDHNTNQPIDPGITADDALYNTLLQFQNGNVFPQPIIPEMQDRHGVLPMSSSIGYTVDLTLSVQDENVRDPQNRTSTGFSVIAISSDDISKSIEIGFTETGIYAYESGPSQALSQTEVALASDFQDWDPTQLTDYEIFVQGDGYTVSANGEEILTGALRDYSSRDPFNSNTNLDPIHMYELPGFVFFGDNSKDAEAVTEFVFTDVEEIPAPGAIALALLAGCAGVCRPRRRRHGA